MQFHLINLNTKTVYCRSISCWALISLYCIKDLDFTDEKNNFLKAKTKGCGFWSYKLDNEKNTVSDLNKDEISSLKTLSKINDLITRKSDEDNSIVLINKSSYLDKMH